MVRSHRKVSDHSSQGQHPRGLRKSQQCPFRGARNWRVWFGKCQCGCLLWDRRESELLPNADHWCFSVGRPSLSSWLGSLHDYSLPLSSCSSLLTTAISQYALSVSCKDVAVRVKDAPISNPLPKICQGSFAEIKSAIHRILAPRGWAGCQEDNLSRFSMQTHNHAQTRTRRRGLTHRKACVHLGVVNCTLRLRGRDIQLYTPTLC